MDRNLLAVVAVVALAVPGLAGCTQPTDGSAGPAMHTITVETAYDDDQGVRVHDHATDLGDGGFRVDGDARLVIGWWGKCQDGCA